MEVLKNFRQENTIGCSTLKVEQPKGQGINIFNRAKDENSDGDYHNSVRVVSQETKPDLSSCTLDFNRAEMESNKMYRRQQLIEKVTSIRSHAEKLLNKRPVESIVICCDTFLKLEGTKSFKKTELAMQLRAHLQEMWNIGSDMHRLIHDIEIGGIE